MVTEIDAIRERLDEIDGRLVAVLAERFQYIDALAEIKTADSLAVRDDARERSVYRRVGALGKDLGLSSKFVEGLFRTILDESVRRQVREVSRISDGAGRDVTVAYQGVPGAFSHMAATRRFGGPSSAVTLQGHGAFDEVVDAVVAGTATYGLLPIENTTAGSINEVYDLLAASDLTIVGEEVEVVDHCLLGTPGTSRHQLRRIRSHPQALLQCSDFLKTLEDCRGEAFEDTAGAAERVALEHDPAEGAIASAAAADYYGLEILERGIANQAENYTRFVVVSRVAGSHPVGTRCKTSVVFAAPHRAGALASCLVLLAEHHLSLTKIESRPRPRVPWEYLFYLDFEGDAADERTNGVLKQLADNTVFFKVLGSYPMLTADSRPSEMSKVVDRPYKLVSRGAGRGDTQVTVGHVVIGDRPVVIAGPCAVESLEQVTACAKAASEYGADLLRGGCFKPRTSPYAFQGLGEEGLEFLRQAGDEFGLPVVTEVLDPRHIDRVAQMADVIQIGARNMQNFELLKAVGQVDVPVILKRGIMASIEEWLSAAEYILCEGNQRVILCERGIRTFETATRNTLDLSAIPVVRERSHLPVIVDPSHAAGVARWIPAMARAALAVGAQGLMVEIHPEPEAALSDGPQALPFDVFGALMSELRVPAADRVAARSRRDLDKLDEQRRFALHPRRQRMAAGSS